MAGRALARLSEAEDPAYWRALAEDLSVADGSRGAATDAVDGESLCARLLHDGFAAVPQAVAAEPVARARAAISVVERAGWPRVFAWVYDELWACARAPRVHAALRSVLGEGYRQLPGLWVNEVAPSRGARGWGPHVDEPGPAETIAGAPARLTAWIALSPATVDNGCMYYVPHHAAPGLAERFSSLERVASDELLGWLHAARPAEAQPGTLLLWRTDLFHWGSVATGLASEPRLALALEAGHERAPVPATRRPALDPRADVSFKERLSVIGRGLLAYGKAKDREPFAHAFVPLGEELCDLWLEEG